MRPLFDEIESQRFPQKYFASFYLLSLVLLLPSVDIEIFDFQSIQLITHICSYSLNMNRFRLRLVSPGDNELIQNILVKYLAIHGNKL